MELPVVTARLEMLGKVVEVSEHSTLYFFCIYLVFL